jgi:hypothetical protein
MSGPPACPTDQVQRCVLGRQRLCLAVYSYFAAESCQTEMGKARRRVTFP